MEAMEAVNDSCVFIAGNKPPSHEQANVYRETIRTALAQLDRVQAEGEKETMTQPEAVDVDQLKKEITGVARYERSQDPVVGGIAFAIDELVARGLLRAKEKP